MGKKFKNLILLVALLISPNSKADLFAQKNETTAKWSRLYARFGKATGEIGEKAQTLNLNALGYLQMRGKFGYGLEYLTIQSKEQKLESTLAVMTLRPDWNLEAEPSVFVAYGLTSLKGDLGGDGSVLVYGLTLDFIKGAFYSTSIGIQNSSFKTNSNTCTSCSFQSVTFSLNLDFY